MNRNYWGFAYVYHSLSIVLQPFPNKHLTFLRIDILVISCYNHIEVSNGSSKRIPVFPEAWSYLETVRRFSPRTDHLDLQLSWGALQAVWRLPRQGLDVWREHPQSLAAKAACVNRALAPVGIDSPHCPLSPALTGVGVGGSAVLSSSFTSRYY